METCATGVESNVNLTFLWPKCRTWMCLMSERTALPAASASPQTAAGATGMPMALVYPACT